MTIREWPLALWLQVPLHQQSATRWSSQHKVWWEVDLHPLPGVLRALWLLASRWAGGPGEKLRAMSFKAPEPSPRPPTGEAQALKQQQTSPQSPPFRPNGGGSLHGLQSVGPVPRNFGPCDSCFLGFLLPQRWWLGEVWGLDPEGATSWDLPPQPGRGTGGRTQTACWTNAPRQGNQRRVSLHQARVWILAGGEKLNLGTLLFLVRTEYHLFQWKVTWSLWPDHDLTWRTKDLTPEFCNN